jgi:hypothetical protein
MIVGVMEGYKLRDLHASHTLGGSRFWFWPDIDNEIFNNGNWRYWNFVVARTVKSTVKRWVSILRSEQIENEEKQKTVRRREWWIRQERWWEFEIRSQEGQDFSAAAAKP